MNEDLKNKILKSFDEFKNDLFPYLNQNELNMEIYDSLFAKALTEEITEEDLIMSDKILVNKSTSHWSSRAIEWIFYQIIANIKENEVDGMLNRYIEDNKSDLLTELVDAKLIPDSYKSKIHSTRSYPID